MSTRLALAWLVSIVLGAGCSHGGGEGSGQFLSGSVLSPGGQALDLVVGGGPLSPQIGGDARLEIEGLAPVPDGTEVALVLLDALGEPAEELATTTTLGGDYAFANPRIGLEPGVDLALVAGSGAKRMRAFAAAHEVDLDPVSEATVQLVLGRAVGLEPFTASEVLDLDGALELVLVVEDVASAADVEQTVALFTTAALADPTFAQFLDAAAAPGQTDQGPGDIGDFFPAHSGDTWGYVASATNNGFPLGVRALERRILGETGSVWQIRERVHRADATPVDETVQKTSTGVVRIATDDPFELFGDVPSLRLRFPLHSGATWLDFEVQDAQLDVNDDRLVDSVDARGVRTVVGFEELTVLDETFPLVARVDLVAELVVHSPVDLDPLDPDPPVATLTASEWYAPGIGLVKSESRLTLTFLVNDRTQREITSRLIDGDGHGILPARTLAEDLIDTNNCLGPPSVAFDGMNYLVVSARDVQGVPEIVALLVTPTGDVLREIAVHALTPTVECPNQRVPVVFDGTNYVVAFSDQRRISCVRIRPEGEVLEPPIQITPRGIVVDFWPALATDGTRSLVAWLRASGEEFSIQGCFVTPAGEALGVFPLVENEVETPRLVYGGGQYLLGWTDYSLASLRVARISLDGEVLDPDGIAVRDGLDQSSNWLALGSAGSGVYLAVWNQQVTGLQHLFARRIGPGGDLLDGEPIQVSATFGGSEPSIDFDGTHYFISWNGASWYGAGIRLRRMSLAGELLDGARDPDGLFVFPFEQQAPFHPSYSALEFGPGHALLAWMMSPRLGQALKEVDAALIYPFD